MFANGSDGSARLGSRGHRRSGGPVDSQTIDADEFRAKQRDSWNIAASGWRKWNELIDRSTSAITERLVELAGVQPGSRVLAAAARIAGFLRPGARLAISSWGPPERVPFLAIPMGTAMRRLEVPPPPPGTPGPLSRPTPDALGGLLESGGFSGVRVEEAHVTF